MDLAFGDAALRLVAVLVLVFVNAFFVASEFALVTVRKTRMDQLVAEGTRFRANGQTRADEA